MAKSEGILAQVRARLNHIDSEIRGKADKWEVRIWFLVLIAVMALLRFV